MIIFVSFYPKTTKMSASVSNNSNNLPINSLSEEFKVTHGGRDSSDAKVRITVKAGRKRKTQESWSRSSATAVGPAGSQTRLRPGRREGKESTGEGRMITWPEIWRAKPQHISFLPRLVQEPSPKSSQAAPPGLSRHSGLGHLHLHLHQSWREGTTSATSVWKRCVLEGQHMATFQGLSPQRKSKYRLICNLWNI